MFWVAGRTRSLSRCHAGIGSEKLIFSTIPTSSEPEPLSPPNENTSCDHVPSAKIFTFNALAAPS